MIVRIVTAGQFRLDDDLITRLNDLDNQLVEVVDQGDRDAFHTLFEQMQDLVRSEGQPLSEDELVPSDVVIPPPDTTFEEAADHFVGEGIFADS